MNVNDVDRSFLGRGYGLSQALFRMSTVEDFRRHIPLVGDTIHVYRHCDDGKEIRRPARHELPFGEKPKWQLVKKLQQEDYCRDVQIEILGPNGLLTLLSLLEAALISGASTDVVEYLCKTDPDAVKKPNQNWCFRVPLHTACLEQHVSESTLQFLLEAYPEAAQKREKTSGGLPLHLYLATRYVVDLQTLQLLVEAYPAAVMTKDSKNCLPLNIACNGASRLSTDVVRYLVSLYPEAVRNSRSFIIYRFPAGNGNPFGGVLVGNPFGGGLGIGRRRAEIIGGRHFQSVPLECLMILTRPFPQALLNAKRSLPRLLNGLQIQGKILAFAELAQREFELQEVWEWMSENCDSMTELQPPSSSSIIRNDGTPTAKRSCRDQSLVEGADTGDEIVDPLHECTVVFQQWAISQRDALQKELQEVSTKLGEMMEEAKLFDVEHNLAD